MSNNSTQVLVFFGPSPELVAERAHADPLNAMVVNHPDGYLVTEVNVNSTCSWAYVTPDGVSVGSNMSKDIVQVMFTMGPALAYAAALRAVYFDAVTFWGASPKRA